MAERDDMVKRIEESVRNRLLALPGLQSLTSIARGDPIEIPVKFYPVGFVMIDEWGEVVDEDRGYQPTTGPTRAYRYDGYVAIEVLVRDPGAPIPGRRWDVPSYTSAKDMAGHAHDSFLAWMEDEKINLEEAVVSADGREKTSELIVSRIRGGLIARPTQDVTNRGEFRFTFYTVKGAV